MLNENGICTNGYNNGICFMLLKYLSCNQGLFIITCDNTVIMFSPDVFVCVCLCLLQCLSVWFSYEGWLPQKQYSEIT